MRILAFYVAGIHSIDALALRGSVRPGPVSSVLQEKDADQGDADLSAAAEHPMHVYAKYYSAGPAS